MKIFIFCFIACGIQWFCSWRQRSLGKLKEIEVDVVRVLGKLFADPGVIHCLGHLISFPSSSHSSLASEASGHAYVWDFWWGNKRSDKGHKDLQRLVSTLISHNFQTDCCLRTHNHLFPHNKMRNSKKSFCFKSINTYFE